MEQNIWRDHKVLELICDALGEVKKAANGSGRAYMTTYQLAIKIDRDHPEVRRALGVGIGGVGTGRHDSFPQYLGRELSRRSGKEGFPVEMAYLSNDHVTTATFEAAGGKEITSSLTGTGYFTSLFRLRD
ncbi:MAG TPA: hypothetical protein VGD48_01445 [Kutzneria sp.]